MNAHSLVPLIAFLAYIPLFAIVLANRPWQRQKTIFAMFLLAMMVWSFGDFLFRSDYFINEKIYIGKATLCVLALGVTQLHYFLRTYYETEVPRFPLAYVLMGVAFVVIIAFIPQAVVVDNYVRPTYGIWVYPLAIAGYGMLIRDLYILLKRLKIIADPVSSNEIIYLAISICTSLATSAVATTKFGLEFPIAHLGNFVTAVILTYAVFKHRLLDLRIVLRRGLTILSMIAFGIIIYLAVYVTGHFLFNVELEHLNFLLGIAIALIVVFIVIPMRKHITSQVDKLFYRDSYIYRQELNNFARNGIRGVLNLDEFGIELLTLFCGAIRCKQSYLMLPQQRH